MERKQLASVWSSVAPAALRFHSWNKEDDGVVYNPVTGDTHLVDALALELLRLVDSSAQTASSLAATLSDEFVEVSSGKIVEFIEATLLQLRDAGLVVRSAIETL